MRDAPGIDVVTRLDDLADLPFLDGLLFALMGQADAGPLRLHVMLPRFSFEEVRAVRTATAGVRRLHDRTSVTLHNWDYPAPFNLRVPLLNHGLDVAQGRYVIPLDVHDQPRPRACAALLARLRGTSAALALGGAALRPVSWWGDVILPAPDRPDEPLPGATFMLDGARLPMGDRVFVSRDDVPETTEFIERISASYAVDTAHRDDVLVVRRSPLGSLAPHRGA